MTPDGQVRQPLPREHRVLLATVLVTLLAPAIKYDLHDRVLAVFRGDPSAMQIVADAGPNTAREGAFSVEILMGTGEPSESGAASSPIRGSIDPSDDTGKMTADLEGFGAGGSGLVEALKVGNVLYVKTPQLGALLPDAPPWIRLDLKSLTAPDSRMNHDLERLASLDEGDQIATAVFLATYFFGSTNEFLSGGFRSAVSEAKAVGREPVRDARTTRYRLALKQEVVTNGVPEELRGELGEQTADAWVDEDGRLRRLQYNTGSAAQGRSIHEFYGFGSKLGVEAPAASESSSPGELLQDSVD